MPSFFIEFPPPTTPPSLTQGGQTIPVETEYIQSLHTEEFHHIINVFRHKVGDVIPLINGKGYSAKAEITEIKKSHLTLRFLDVSYTPPPTHKIACAFSLLKIKHDLLIVEKLTELGVSDLFPMTTKYSVKQSKENTTNKMKKVAIAACKQCDNPYLPTIHPVRDLAGTLEHITQLGYTPIVASEQRPDNPLSLTPYPFQPCILIGPEGGFDPAEFALFTDRQIPQVSLCQNILRAETAAICAVSILVSQRTYCSTN